MYFARASSVNNDVSDLLRYNFIRLYLIKTFRGKAQALGKPSRGQRTWSNARTARKMGTPLKSFVGEMRKVYGKKKTIESKNKKIIKKKNKIIIPSKIRQKSEPVNVWF